MTKMALANLNAADEGGFMAALGDVYEHAPWVAQAASRRRPFATLAALHAAMMDAVRAAPPEQRLALIKGHPDLAGKAARAGSMTVDSKAEQASAGLDRLAEAEFAQFHRLNDAYREKFGMPFVICVRRHSKDSILQQFERRLQNTMSAETETALGEIFRIAALRLDQRIEAADRLEVSANGEQRMIARAMTNRDGRTDEPLIGGRPLPIGRYELRFHVADYFAGVGARQDEPPFLDVVPVRFAVAEAEGHYHVPLLLTPWSYGTYRGS